MLVPAGNKVGVACNCLGRVTSHFAFESEISIEESVLNRESDGMCTWGDCPCMRRELKRVSRTQEVTPSRRATRIR